MTRRWLRSIGMTATALVFACGEHVVEPVARTDTSTMVLSEVMDGSGGTVVWISLPPGTVPGGNAGTISTALGGATRSVVVVDGGFDPVPIPALAGDTVTLWIRDTAGVVTTQVVPVPLRAPPIVVRTDPPKRKKDVPLNLRAFVVFSEPMDSRTVNHTTIRLLRDGQPVVGTVTLSAEGWEAAFEPSAALAAATTYVLEVTTGVTDLAGDALGASWSTEFTTRAGASPPPTVARVEIIPDSTTLMLGAKDILVARALDSAGNVLNRMVFWRSSDTTVVKVAPYGFVTPAGLGTATVSAARDGVADTAAITVLPASALWMAQLHACAATADGRVYCWGNDYQGHLGVPPDASCSFLVNDGTYSDAGCVKVPSPVRSAPAFASVVGGAFFSCALTAAGVAYCWGNGWAGKLGDGDTTRHLVTAPRAVAGGFVFTRLAAGSSYACGLTTGGQAYCWGYNGQGQLGDGTQTDRGIPVEVAGGHAFVTIGAFWRHTCGVDTEGQGWCWGDNGRGQLGIDTVGGVRPVPTAVAGATRFSTIEPGTDHTCGLTADGTAYCWGSNRWGALGIANDTAVAVKAPVSVQTSLRFARLDLGEAFSCALGRADGGAYCWGARHTADDTYAAVDREPMPVDAVSGVSFTSLGVGRWAVCGIGTDDRIACWGNDFTGQTIPFRRP